MPESTEPASGLSVTALVQTLNADMLLAWAFKLGGGLLVLFLGWMVSRWVAALAGRALERTRLDAALARILATVIRYTVVFVALIAAAETVGIQTTSLIALLGTAGIAVGLALQGSLSNIASGVMILVFRPFTIGDVVSGGGKTGSVTDIGLFATTMMLPDGTRVTIPNSGITGGVIENHTTMGRRRSTTAVGVAYGSDLDEVRAALTRAVQSLDTLLPKGDDPGYSIVFRGFGTHALEWEVYVHTLPGDWWSTQEKVKIAIYRELNEAGIGIPLPQVDVRLDGALAAAPVARGAPLST